MSGKRWCDQYLLGASIILISIGIVMIYGTTSAISLRTYGDSYHIFKKHLVWVGIGGVVMFLARRMDYHRIRIFTYPLLFLSFFLLLMVIIPSVGTKVGGARRWLRLGGLSFQPGELAKVSIIIFLAHSLTKRREEIKEFVQGFLPNIFVVGLCCLLILVEPDLGTAFLIFVVSMFVMYMGGVSILHLIGLIGVISPMAYFAVFNVEYRRRRIMAFVDPWKDPQGSGFQIIQSLVSFGRGHIAGVGIGEGKQKLFFLPEAHTDFIFSVIGEELGLIGSILTLSVFFLLVARGIRISLKAPDLYGKYLAFGITVMLALQIVLNICVTIGLFPPKGIPLPLVSVGGSSLVVAMGMIGILLNISEQIR